MLPSKLIFAHFVPLVMVGLLCRRAVALLYLKKHKKCVSDCNAAVTMDPLCFHAYVIRCLANIYLSNFSQAVEDHEEAVALTGGNVVLLERLDELKSSLEIVRCSTVYGAKGSVAAAVEWIGDFGLLGLENIGASSGTSSSSTASGKRRKESHQGLPKLIPAGEWLGPDICEQLLDYTSYKLNEKAVKEKQKGNAEFAAGNYKRALQLYTRAIKLNPDERLFYSNRALVYLKLCRYEEAISDCTASIARGPTIKGSTFFFLLFVLFLLFFKKKLMREELLHWIIFICICKRYKITVILLLLNHVILVVWLRSKSVWRRCWLKMV